MIVTWRVVGIDLSGDARDGGGKFFILGAEGDRRPGLGADECEVVAGEGEHYFEAVRGIHLGEGATYVDVGSDVGGGGADAAGVGGAEAGAFEIALGAGDVGFGGIELGFGAYHLRLAEDEVGGLGAGCAEALPIALGLGGAGFFGGEGKGGVCFCCAGGGERGDVIGVVDGEEDIAFIEGGSGFEVIRYGDDAATYFAGGYGLGAGDDGSL